MLKRHFKFFLKLKMELSWEGGLLLCREIDCSKSRDRHRCWDSAWQKCKLLLQPRLRVSQ